VIRGRIGYNDPMSKKTYDALAPYYDALHATLTADVDFVLELASEQEGPVLELGCGTGRLLLPLAQAGVAVTGIDASAAMLARARQRVEAAALPADRVRLVEADMTRFELPTRDYALVLISYNTFFHLDPTAAVAACRRARAHTRCGARLFVDITNPFLMGEEADADGTVTLERTLSGADQENVVLVFSSSRLDAAAQQLTVTWIFETSARAGGPVQRTVVEEQYHFYYPHQMELILEESGFRLRTLLGDYDGAPFSEDSARLLVLAEAV
jgi:SAM-dependent methyltransferase